MSQTTKTNFEAENLFNKYDVDGSESIDKDELLTMITDVYQQKGKTAPTVEEINNLVMKFDVNGDNQISKQEFYELYNSLF